MQRHLAQDRDGNWIGRGDPVVIVRCFRPALNGARAVVTAVQKHWSGAAMVRLRQPGTSAQAALWLPAVQILIDRS